MKIVPNCSNFKSVRIIKKKGLDKILLLAKAKLNIIKVFISKALIESYINHDEFVSANNMFSECHKMEEEIKNPKNSVKYTVWIWSI